MREGLQAEQVKRRRVATLCEDRLARRLRRIETFHPLWRRSIQELTTGSDPAEDLADSFPALLFALASGYGTARGREQALGLVAAGAPLRTAADALGLPWWLRRLPAPAFVQPLGAVPGDAEFATQISNLVPALPARTASWLDQVLCAHQACHSLFALWVAKHLPHHGANRRDEILMYLAAWAWHADRPDTTGHRILRRPWSSAISLRRALDELVNWRRRSELAITLGSGLDRTWLSAGSAAGYQFVPLRTIDDFIAESVAMDNCLDRYGDKIDGSTCRVFSVRRRGQAVADVELSPHFTDAQMPAVAQVRGPRNRRAPPEVWRAVYAWMGAQTIEPIGADGLPPRPADRRRARRAFWQPYLSAIDSARRPAFERLLQARQRDRRGALEPPTPITDTDGTDR
jgi:hypothetical protein